MNKDSTTAVSGPNEGSLMTDLFWAKASVALEHTSIPWGLLGATDRSAANKTADGGRKAGEVLPWQMDCDGASIQRATLAELEQWVDDEVPHVERVYRVHRYVAPGRESADHEIKVSFGWGERTGAELEVSLSAPDRATANGLADLMQRRIERLVSDTYVAELCQLPPKDEPQRAATLSSTDGRTLSMATAMLATAHVSTDQSRPVYEPLSRRVATGVASGLIVALLVWLVASVVWPRITG